LISRPTGNHINSGLLPELISDRKSINLTDKKGIGRLKPKETRDLHFYSNSTLVEEILPKLAGW
jgi:putative transposase